MIRVGDVGRRIGFPLHLPLHVGLTRCQPNFADQNVLPLNRFCSRFDRQFLRRGIRLHRIQCHHPFPGLSFRSFPLTSKLDRHIVAILCSAPNSYRLLTLQYHRIGKDARQIDVLSRDRKKWIEQENKQRQVIWFHRAVTFHRVSTFGRARLFFRAGHRELTIRSDVHDSASGGRKCPQERV